MVRVQTISPRPQFNTFSRDTVPLKEINPEKKENNEKMKHSRKNKRKK